MLKTIKMTNLCITISYSKTILNFGKEIEYFFMSDSLFPKIIF